MVVCKRRQNFDVDHCALQNSTNIDRPRWTRIICMLFRILQIFLIVKTSFWNEKRSTHSKGFYIKKNKSGGCFIHENRSICIQEWFPRKEINQYFFFKSRRSLLVHHPGKNILVTDSIFEGLSPANKTDAPPLNFLNKNISVLTHK